VTSQKGTGIQSTRFCFFHRLRIRNGARGIGGSIGTVRAAAEHYRSLRQIQRGGQDKFLIAATQAIPIERHRRLATRDQAGRGRNRPVALGHLAGDRGVHPRYILRLTLNGGRQHQGPVTTSLRLYSRRIHRQPVGSHNQRTRVLQPHRILLGRTFEMPRDRLRRLDLVTRQNRPRFGERRVIGHRGPGANHTQVIANHVRKYQRQQLRRRGQRG